MGAEDRRRTVLEAAIEVFAEDGIHGASMARIAESAGVAKASCYEVFPSKDHLYAEAVAQADSRFGAALAAARVGADSLSRRERLRRRFAAMFDFAREHPASFRLLSLSWHDPTPDVLETRVVTRDALVDRLAADLRRELPDTVVTEHRLDRVLATVLFGVAASSLQAGVEDPTLDPGAVVDMLTDFTLGGLERLADGPDQVSGS